MALGYNVIRRFTVGDLTVRVVDLTLDTDYAAGGYTVAPASVGLGSTGTIVFVIPASSAGGFLTEFNHTTGKLLVKDHSSAVGVAAPEVANGLDAITGVVVRCLIFGIGHG